mmetsp:Transcript_21548/g.72526  ORF Transcript_21548/g.72526 Transcript_21548/m.72526 type:complete len:228 (-) Transcript_21548:1407-2090(-)
MGCTRRDHNVKQTRKSGGEQEGASQRGQSRPSPRGAGGRMVATGPCHGLCARQRGQSRWGTQSAFASLGHLVGWPQRPRAGAPRGGGAPVPGTRGDGAPSGGGGPVPGARGGQRAALRQRSRPPPSENAFRSGSGRRPSRPRAPWRRSPRGTRRPGARRGPRGRWRARAGGARRCGRSRRSPRRSWGPSPGRRRGRRCAGSGGSRGPCWSAPRPRRPWSRPCPPCRG